MKSQEILLEINKLLEEVRELGALKPDDEEPSVVLRYQAPKHLEIIEREGAKYLIELWGRGYQVF
jgi:hypothetical protein